VRRSQDFNEAYDGEDFVEFIQKDNVCSVDTSIAKSLGCVIRKHSVKLGQLSNQSKYTRSTMGMR